MLFFNKTFGLFFKFKYIILTIILWKKTSKFLHKIIFLKICLNLLKFFNSKMNN